MYMRLQITENTPLRAIEKLEDELKRVYAVHLDHRIHNFRVTGFKARSRIYLDMLVVKHDEIEDISFGSNDKTNIVIELKLDKDATIKDVNDICSKVKQLAQYRRVNLDTIHITAPLKDCEISVEGLSQLQKTEKKIKSIAVVDKELDAIIAIERATNDYCEFYGKDVEEYEEGVGCIHGECGICPYYLGEEESEQ